MGAKLTVIENKSGEEMEVRVFVPPDRPGQFRGIIRIKPGGVEKLTATAFNYEDTNPQGPPTHEDITTEGPSHEDTDPEGPNYTYLMIYLNGVYTRKYLLPFHLMKYAHLSCERNEKGVLIVRGIKSRFNFCRLKVCALFPGKYCCGVLEEDIA